MRSRMALMTDSRAGGAPTHARRVNPVQEMAEDTYTIQRRNWVMARITGAGASLRPGQIGKINQDRSARSSPRHQAAIQRGSARIGFTGATRSRRFLGPGGAFDQRVGDAQQRYRAV